jgi:hypothetical protein
LLWNKKHHKYIKALSTVRIILVLAGIIILGVSCDNATNQKVEQKISKSITAKDILGNPDYLAISYGGYRMKSRDSQPTLKQLKENNTF